jgi:hypothetical protein
MEKGCPHWIHSTSSLLSYRTSNLAIIWVTQTWNWSRYCIVGCRCVLWRHLTNQVAFTPDLDVLHWTVYLGCNRVFFDCGYTIQVVKVASLYNVRLKTFSDVIKQPRSHTPGGNICLELSNEPFHFHNRLQQWILERQHAILTGENYRNARFHQ